MSRPPLEDCVLIVEDEFLIAEGLTLALEALGLRVCGAAATADEALEMAVAHRPMLVLMDMRLRGEKDGVDAALAIHDQVGGKTIFLTGSREPATLARIALDHASAVLFKPVADAPLRAAIEMALGPDVFGRAQASRPG